MQHGRRYTTEPFGAMSWNLHVGSSACNGMPEEYGEHHDPSRHPVCVGWTIAARRQHARGMWRRSPSDGLLLPRGTISPHAPAPNQRPDPVAMRGGVGRHRHADLYLPAPRTDTAW